jgi:hypothetical protein
VFNMIEEIFAPGRKHIAEEQKRLELTRVDVDGADPGRGPIDLASGKVTIRLGSGPVAPHEPEADESGDTGPAGTVLGTGPGAGVPRQVREEAQAAKPDPAA